MERQKLKIYLRSVMELPYIDNFFERVFHYSDGSSLVGIKME